MLSNPSIPSPPPCPPPPILDTSSESTRVPYPSVMRMKCALTHSIHTLIHIVHLCDVFVFPPHRIIFYSSVNAAAAVTSRSHTHTRAGKREVTRRRNICDAAKCWGHIHTHTHTRCFTPAIVSTHTELAHTPAHIPGQLLCAMARAHAKKHSTQSSDACVCTYAAAFAPPCVNHSHAPHTCVCVCECTYVRMTLIAKKSL